MERREGEREKEKGERGSVGESCGNKGEDRERGRKRSRDQMQLHGRGPGERTETRHHMQLC